MWLVVDNNQMIGKDVWFDNVSIQHYNSIVLEEGHYYPFGLTMNINAAQAQGEKNPYKLTTKELESKFDLNMYDFGARMQDMQLGRWWSVDNSAESYYSYSPYNYTVNNPVNVIDPDGNDVYVLTWFSKNGETGHAGIAVDNYKTQNKKDAKGNDVLDKNGKPVTEQVKDGTFTYYDLWPESPVGKTELQDNVKDDYNKKTVKSFSELTTTDVSRSGEKGKVSENGEGRAADGIVQIKTTFGQDNAIKSNLGTLQGSGKDYNACYNNCSSFVQNGLKAILPSFNASQPIRPSGALRIMHNDATTVAPNNLYNAALKVKGAASVKGPPNGVVAKPYLEYFGKSNRP